MNAVDITNSPGINTSQAIQTHTRDGFLSSCTWENFGDPCLELATSRQQAPLAAVADDLQGRHVVSAKKWPPVQSVVACRQR